MIHIDLFSGLGLFSYAADHVWNLEHVFCEIENWPYRFLKQEYPDARIERDVRKFDGTEYAGRTFLLSGGCPCQPASIAGKRKGTEDDRWLWPEAIRVMAEAQPEWAIFENPLGILTLEKGLVFENLLLEMESQGYSVQPYIIPACGIGAVHRRDRVWIVAHSESTRLKTRSGNGLGIGKPGRLHAPHINSNAQDTKQPGTGGKEREISNKERETGEGGREGLRQGNGTIGASRTTSANSDASNSSITRSWQLSESERRDNPANVDGQNQRLVANPDRFNGNNGRHDSGEICGELGQEDEIQGCEDVANSERPGLEGTKPTMETQPGRRIAEHNRESWQRPWPEVATELCGVFISPTDRIHRLKALGNTIMFEVAMELMKGIEYVSRPQRPIRIGV